jgi:hypothetical protein
MIGWGARHALVAAPRRESFRAATTTVVASIARVLVVALVASLLFAEIGEAAVAFVNANTPLKSTSGTTLSGVQSVNSGTDLVAIVVVGFRGQYGNPTTISSVKLNNTAMAAVDGQLTISSGFNLQAFYLAAPPTGTPTLSITFSQAVWEAAAAVVVYSGVSQSMPIRSGSSTRFSGSSDTAATGSVTIPSAEGDRTVSGSTSLGGSVSTNQTLRWIALPGNAFDAADDAAGTTSVTHTWNVTFQGSPIGIQGFSIQSAAGAPPPDVVGQWGAGPTLPYFPVHAHLLPNGSVMLWPGDEGISGNDPRLWNPATNQLSALAKPGYDLFCSGHAFMADGWLFVAGGHIQNGVGLAKASRYDPATDSWTAEPDMNAGRWYPTVTTLSNGDMLVVSGSIDNTTGVDTLPQVFEASTGTWRDLSSALLGMDLYPQMLLAPNGRVFNPGPSATTRYLDTSGTGSWTVVATRGGGYRDYGSAVMYDDGKVLVIGGGDPPQNTAEVIDLNAPSPAWRAVQSMQFVRRQLNAVLLPDGRVLVTGGTSGAGFNNPDSPVYDAELWDPVTETWTTLAPATVPRLYHSATLLLPDGRVLSTGGNGYPQTELFSPPYLFKGARPTITSAPSRVAYGETFFVGTPNAAAITAVTWLRLSSVTHAFNANQRINRLSFSAVAGGLNVAAPATANLAPPGDYILFILNGQGIPSVASIMRVGATTPASPAITQLTPSSATAGGPGFTLTVTGSGFVSGSTVQWNSATRTTTFVSGTQLTAAIPASDIASTGTANVTVTNPAPGGGTSNTVTFTVQAASSFTLTVIRSGNGLVTSQPGGINCGSVCVTSYASGTVVTLTAIPSKSQKFVGWTGACTGTATICTVTMNDAKSVGASFKGGK